MVIRIILNLIFVKCGELCYIYIYIYHLKRKGRFFLTKYLKFFIVQAVASFSMANYKRRVRRSARAFVRHDEKYSFPNPEEPVSSIDFISYLFFFLNNWN